MKFRIRPLITRTPLTIVRLSVFLLLSTCSLSAYSNAEGHAPGESKAGQHDDAMDDQHASDVRHGDVEDHLESMAGTPGLTENITRTVDVFMDDTMAFTPSELTVKAGETIRFTVNNRGKLVHEFVLGTPEEILEHHELMKRFPGMEHDEPNSVSLETSESGDVVWQFTKPGTFQFACLKPGHYQAGMKGDVVVSIQQPREFSLNLTDDDVSTATARTHAHSIR